ncbi:MAG TPA: amidohydrolase family protein [Stellaceae bacterium]|nr:amidohydrolase family protein [Stellaceae bacterium]
MAGVQRIDIHHHIWPPRWLESPPDWLSGRSGDVAPAANWDFVSKWTPSMTIDAMGKNDIAVTVTSVSSMVVHPDEPQLDADFARECNEFGARLAQDNKGLIGTFAMLPLPHVDQCLNEIAYAAGPLKADGFKLQTSYSGRSLGDPAFDPVWDDLNRRKAAVFIHPVVPEGCMKLVPDLPVALMEYPFDTTRAISSLLFHGTFTRYPDIKFIFAHGGGTVPFLANRIAGAARSRRDFAAYMPHGIQAALRNLYFDVVSVTNKFAWASLTTFVDPSHLLYGTDIPYGTFERATHELAEMELSAAQLRGIERDNALAIMPSLAR